MISYGFVGLSEIVNSCIINFPFPGNLKSRYTGIVIMLILSIILFIGFYKNKYPIQNEEIKKTISYIQKQKGSNDKIYLYHASTKAFDYYKKIGFVDFPDKDVIYGINNRGYKDKYISSLSSLHGKVWLLFSHFYDNEQSFILNKLDSLGKRRIKKFSAKGTAAYLYEFKN